MNVHATVPKIVWEQCNSFLDDDERHAATELGREYARFLMGHRDKSPSGDHFSIWQNWQVRCRVYLLLWHRNLLLPRHRNRIWERMITEGKIP